LYVATGFFVRGTLVGGLFCLVVVGGILYFAAGLRCSDIGWCWSTFSVGLLVTFILWAAMHVVVAILAAINGETALDPAWKQIGPIAIAGAFVGQLLGNALAEETVFRGFLLPQIYFKAAASTRGRAALAIALIGSSLLFAISHLPQRILVARLAGADLLPDQVALFFFGLFHAATYVVTRNLFVAVGIHALINEPTSIFQSPNVDANRAIVSLLSLVLLIIWYVLAVDSNRNSTSHQRE
jgi:membrane protease YdiL (CAAX protease family)